MRYCTKCQSNREDSEFNANGSKSNGIQSWCRTCTIEYNRKWYALNRDRHSKYVSDHKDRKIHTCKNCGRSEPEVSFYIKKDGSRYYRRFLCHGCDLEYKKLYPTSAAAKKRHRERSRNLVSVQRKMPEHRYRFVYLDARRMDKKRYLKNDLDHGFVRDMLAMKCAYCGDADGKMGLDRIDNKLGHEKTNVNPCCSRCNMFRRNMPYEAWSLLIPALRQARETGLLDGWDYGTKSHTESKVNKAVVDSLSRL